MAGGAGVAVRVVGGAADHAVDAVTVDLLAQHPHGVGGRIFLQPRADQVMHIKAGARREGFAVAGGDAGVVAAMQHAR